MRPAFPRSKVQPLVSSRIVPVQVTAIAPFDLALGVNSGEFLSEAGFAKREGIAMRVMLVSGGGYQYLGAVLPAMERLGTEFRNVATDALDSPAPRLVPRRFSRYFFDRTSIGAFRREIEAFRPDIVHTMGLRQHLIKTLVAMRAFPSVGLIYERISAGGMNPLSPIDPFIFRHPRIDRMVMPSRAMLNNWLGNRYLRWIARRERCEPLHYAFDLPALTSLDEKRVLRVRLGLDPDAFIIGTVCHIRPFKNVDFVADVVTQIASDRPVCFAVVGGHGRNEGYMHRVRKVGGDRLKLIGFVPDAHRIMAAFDLYVTPTALPGESFGMAFAEAMAHAIPGITMNYGASAEVCDHGVTGYALPERKSSWRRHIEELMNDQALRLSMGAASRQRIAERFSPEARATDYLRLYETVVEERRVKRALTKA